VLIGALKHRTLLPASAQELLSQAAEVRRRLTDGIGATGAMSIEELAVASPRAGRA
jgi:hypothetical protein